ncbi:MAG: putative metal-dependent hydrolase [Bryobacteraceae bacterium]
MAQDLRYPVGDFHPTLSRSPEDREAWLKELEMLPKDLRAAIEGLSETQLDMPYREGGWTVRQVVHHFADSHLNSYTRFRLAVTEDNPTIKPYDEARWADLDDARNAPAEVSLRLLEGLHDRWVRLIRSFGEEDFSKTFRHPERGEMDLNQTLALYAWHCRHHLAHIHGLRERNGW